MATSSTSTTPTPVRPIAFWALGLLNNASYVIMLASAKDISEGGTALVFLANVIPGLSIKLSAPYWFDRISYDARIAMATLFMAGSFLTVAIFQTSTSSLSLCFQLLGVALASAQCGLGEASLLALAGACDAPRPEPACLTCFSSGTGLAGVFGFFYVFLLNDLFGISLRMTLVLALSLPGMYIGVYRRYLWGRKIGDCIELLESTRDQYQKPTAVPVNEEEIVEDTCLEGDDTFDDEEGTVEMTTRQRRFQNEQLHPALTAIGDMTTYQRLRLTCSLYPYMIPLFFVYVAEYALQAGTWTAIGFPITSESARDDFYFAANWSYQAGVFLSRSSGTLFTAPVWFIWLMPALQCLNVVVFWVVAAHHVWYSWWLLTGCFYVGLLGGAVYVHGYTRICLDVPKEHAEFALSATSVAADVGVVVADAVGIYMQSCLYAVNGLPGALVECPVKFR
jgi:battenin